MISGLCPDPKIPDLKILMIITYKWRLNGRSGWLMLINVIILNIFFI